MSATWIIPASILISLAMVASVGLFRGLLHPSAIPGWHYALGLIVGFLCGCTHQRLVGSRRAR
jgi:hypothetical protein